MPGKWKLAAPQHAHNGTGTYEFEHAYAPSFEHERHSDKTRGETFDFEVRREGMVMRLHGEVALVSGAVNGMGEVEAKLCLPRKGPR